MAGLDDLESGYQATMGGSPIAAPIATPSFNLDSLESNYQAQAPSETQRVGSEFTKGLGNLLGLVNQVSPIRPEVIAGEVPAGVIPGAGLPPLFGLTNYLQGKFGIGKTDYGPDFGQQFNQVAHDTGAMVDAKPQTTAGKLIGDVGREAIPGLLFGPGMAALAGATSGPGSYLGREFGGALGIAPQTGESLGAVLGGFTPAGIAKLAGTGAKLIAPAIGATDATIGNLARQFATAPGEAVGAVKAFNAAEPTNFSPFMSTAEVSADPGLSRFEDAVRQYLPNENVVTNNADRSRARSDQLMSMFNPDVGKLEASKTLESQIGEAAGNIKQSTQDVWDSLDKSSPVIATDAIPAMQSAIEKYAVTLDNAPGRVQSLFNKIADQATNEDTTLGHVQAWRKQIGDIARDTSDQTERQMLKGMDSALDDTLSANVDAGILGADQADALKAARAATANKYATLGATPELSVASGIKDGNLWDTKFANAVLNSPDKFQATLDAAQKGGIDIVPTMKQILMDSITKDANGLPVAQSQWAKNFSKRTDQFNAVFSPDELDQIQASIDDYAAQMGKESSAFATKQSATDRRGGERGRIDSAKGLVNPQLIDKLGNAVSAAATVLPAIRGAGSLGSMVTGGIGGIASMMATNVAKGLAAGPSAKFDQRLLDFISNPAAAEQILGSGKVIDWLGGVAKPIAQAAVNTTAQDALSRLTANAVANQIVDRSGGIMAGNPTSPVTAFAPNVPQGAAPDEPILDGVPLSQVLDGIRQVESGGGKNLKSPKGALGPYQFMPATAADLGLANPMDEDTSRAAASKYILSLFKQTGNLDDALAAYNFGIGNVLKGKSRPKETLDYPGKVMSAIAALNGTA